MSTPLHCVGALIVDDRGRIFVQRRSPTRRLFANCWDVVGGHLEPGESVMQALHREVAEETGWRVTEVLDIVGEYAYRGDDGQDRIECDFLVRVAGDLDAPCLEAGKHTEFRWLEPAGLDLLDEYKPPSEWLLRELVAGGFDALHHPELAPTAFAGRVAAAVDRAFIDGMVAARGADRERLARHGPGAGRVLVEFRTALAWPDRTVTPEQFAAVVRYRDHDAERRGVAAQAAAGRLAVDGRGGFRATGRGHEFLADLWAVQADGLAGVWRDAALVGRLNRGLARLLAAADRSGGPAWQAMAPAYEPEGAAGTVLLLNRLGTLRYHRADAHAAAWTAAGLTAAGVQALPAGPERDQIEVETDVRAAAPYAALSVDERLGLLADLAALPGQRRD
jgi:8-oxo-dGTP pyrophosphatase MutT (NUDIX family)